MCTIIGTPASSTLWITVITPLESKALFSCQVSFCWKTLELNSNPMPFVILSYEVLIKWWGLSKLFCVLFSHRRSTWCPLRVTTPPKAFPWHYRGSSMNSSTAISPSAQRNWPSLLGIVDFLKMRLLVMHKNNNSSDNSVSSNGRSINTLYVQYIWWV